MLTTLEEALIYLEKYIPRPQAKFPGLIGLKRIEKLLSILGAPHLSYPTIHVGGTSGKGSTATFIASILATEYKVGLYTSPHLMKVNERIKIIRKVKSQNAKVKSTIQNSKIFHTLDISDRNFIRVLNLLVPLIAEMDNTKYGPPSYFEIITAMAFLYFRTQKVDIAVIEVGLGGRYDATNVVKPLVAVLTNVGLDHTEVLGNTVEEIALDKVGIIKKNIHVVTGVTQPSVKKIVRSKCSETNSQLLLLNRNFSYKVKKIDLNGSVFDYRGSSEYQNLKTGLVGEHQIRNASLAIKTIKQLSIINYQFTIGEIRQGLRNAYVSARFEIHNRKPLVIIDGAHNQDKMKALVKAVKVIYPGKKITVILAIKSDKNAKDILRELVKISQRIILTQYRLRTDVGDTVSHDPNLLSKIVKEIDPAIDIMKIKSPLEALRYASFHVSSRDLILVTGSLYLIGEIKKFSMV